LIFGIFHMYKNYYFEKFWGPRAQRPWCMCTTCTMVNPALPECHDSAAGLVTPDQNKNVETY